MYRCFISIFLLLLFFTACSFFPSVGKDYKEPEISLPKSYKGGEQTQKMDAQVKLVCLELNKWWQLFKMSELDRLIRSARGNNHDIKIAQSNLRQARANLVISNSSFYPSIDAQGNISRRKSSSSANSFGNDGADISGVGGGLNTFYQAGFDSLWEIDIFGGLRRAKEASIAEFEAATFAFDAVEVSLDAEVANIYIGLLSLIQQKEITQNNIRVQEESLALVRERFAAGLVSELDVVQAQTQLEITRSVLPSTESDIQSAYNSLAILLGQTPSLDFDSSVNSAFVKLEVIQAHISSEPFVGVPSELLRNRPDIKTLERKLAFATARVGVAVSDLYPRFSITGTFGFQNKDRGDLFTLSKSEYWTLVPGFRWMIFDAGKVRANIDVQTEEEEKALLLYEKTILSAISEVENSLAGVRAESERYISLDKSFQASKRALDLSKDLYKTGLVDFQRVLEAQKSLFLAEDTRLLSIRNKLITLIALYKALGGDSYCSKS